MSPLLPLLLLGCPGPKSTDTGLLPTVTLVTPAAGDEVHGEVPILAQASGVAVLERVTFRVDEQDLADDLDSPYEGTLPSDLLSEGLHTLSAVAVDVLGGSATDSVEVRVDRTPPVVVFTTPAEGDTLEGPSTLEVTVEDAGTIDTMDLALDGGPLVSWTAPPYSLDWDARTVGWGSHLLSATATDRAGWSTTASITIQAGSAPTLELDSPEDRDTVQGEVALAVTLTSAAPVTQVEYAVDGTSVATATASPWSATWDSCTASRGEHALVATGTDDLGNTFSDSVTVQVSQPIQVALRIPEGPVDDTTVLDAWAWNDTSIRSVEFDVDGLVLTTASMGTDMGAAPCDLTCGCIYYGTTRTLEDVEPGDHTLTATATGVDGETAADSVSIQVAHDMDGDGYLGLTSGGEDCDDADASIHPGVSEDCDGVDQDCDGTVDEDATNGLTWYTDADGDGYGDPLAPVRACTLPDGASADGSDCDDTQRTVHPGATETCCSGRGT